MLITRNVIPYTCLNTDSIESALVKIDGNKHGIVFITNLSGILQGSLTDGDFRRWLTKNNTYSKDALVTEIMFRQVRYESVKTSTKDLSKRFDTRVGIIPLVDDRKRLQAIAIQGDPGIQVGKCIINESNPVFIIAEIGNNHNGDLSLAKRLVELAVDSGADCVKFQLRNMAALYGAETSALVSDSEDLGSQYILDLLHRVQLPNDQLLDIFDYCKSLGVLPLCTAWDLQSVEVLEDYGIEAYKLASADLTNWPLLEALAMTGKPLLCSTGMSTESEIRSTVDYLKRKASQFVLLHCNSTYPTPYKDVNLEYINRLKEIGNGLVGYSGHERGYAVPVAAVAMGAKVIEKHFTIDKTMEGNDHKVSLLPGEFSEMVEAIRAVEIALGSAKEREPTQGEKINRDTLAKSLVSNVSIKEGEIISRHKIDVKSPGQGLQPCYIDDLVGRVAKRDIKQNDYFYKSDIEDHFVTPRSYSFDRPFGIPVRFHDYMKLKDKTNLDLVEFHLSYRDLELDINEYLNEPQKLHLVVHAPELFRKDHIIDLASDDGIYRNKSIACLQMVLDCTRKLKRFFPNSDKPLIVLNAGGYTKKSFVEEAKRSAMYQRVADALDDLEQQGLEIIIQNMPPFPWHFGGQSYHNLFVDPHEIERFCSQHGVRVCCDISHAKLACNYYGWEMDYFLRTVGNHIAHLHVADATGVDGEGIQVGEGELDFNRIFDLLRDIAPKASFIPEIWQGHKNNGEGFWPALENLERC